MPSFGKKNYTNPVASKHDNNVLKDWYVFFRFKHEDKIYKIKRREGINRIKAFEEREVALLKLKKEIEFDLAHGWNPILDRKRGKDYL